MQQHTDHKMAVEHASRRFAAHPGFIHIRYKWNGSEQMLSAANLPDTRRFVYYDASGHEVDDPTTAEYRVPIEEEDVITLDAKGTSVEPRYAAFISVMQYGPAHRYLREVQAKGTP